MAEKERKDNVKGMHISRDNVERARSGLVSGFIWAETREGDAYWAQISNRLAEILKEEA